MKRSAIVIMLLCCVALASAQFRSFGVTVGAGYTAVNIEEAINYYGLEDWDHFGIILKASGEYELKPGLHLVGELGTNRLYYWEYYWSDGYYDGYRWRSEWTTNLGVSVKKLLGESLFFQVGPGVHIFNDGSGTVLGLLLGLGYDIDVTDQIKVPIGIRVESVFGNSLPTSLLFSTGIRYDL